MTCDMESAQWFGVYDDQMAVVLPNLANFPESDIIKQQDMYRFPAFDTPSVTSSTTRNAATSSEAGTLLKVAVADERRPSRSHSSAFARYTCVGVRA